LCFICFGFFFGACSSTAPMSVPSLALRFFTPG
jgi:hypothetical protein